MDQDLDFEEFAEIWREQGRPPVTDRVELQASTLTPLVGATIELTWHGIWGQTVELWCNGLIVLTDQPADGQTRVLINSLETRQFTAICGAARAQLEVRPRITIPEIRNLQVPLTAFDNQDAFDVTYEVAQAQRVWLTVYKDSEQIAQFHLRQHRGLISIPQRGRGEYLVTLDAVSEHAELDPQAHVQQSVTFRVQRPLPVIQGFTLDKAAWEINQEPGQVSWEVRHAENIYLFLSGEQNARLVDAQGAISLPELPRGEYDVILQAVNLDGEVCTESLSFRVNYPTVQLEQFETSSKRVHLGQTHTLAWRVCGALSVTLQANGSVISQEPNGVATIRLWDDDATYQLIYESYQGRIKTKQISVMLDLMPPEPEIELDRIYRVLYRKE